MAATAAISLIGTHMNRTLRITAAIWVGGVLCVPDDLVEVTAYEARDLVRRGRAVYHEESEGDAVVVITQNAEPSLHPAIAAFNDDSAPGDGGAPDQVASTALSSPVTQAETASAPPAQAPRRGRPPKVGK